MKQVRKTNSLVLFVCGSTVMSGWVAELVIKGTLYSVITGIVFNVAPVVAGPR